MQLNSKKKTQTRIIPSPQIRRLAQDKMAEFPKKDGEVIRKILQLEKIKSLQSACAAKSNSQPPPPAPKSLTEEMARKYAASWAKACDEELHGHDTTLNSWVYEKSLSQGKTLPHTTKFKAKKNMYGEIERQNIFLAICGDQSRPVLYFDETRMASHMPS